MQLTDYTKPTPIVSQYLGQVPAGQALDIGSFEGRNALYLARLGWSVIAIDTDEQALKVLQKVADNEGLHIVTKVIDVRDYQPTESFDAILSLMTLHFLPEEAINSTMAKMQSWTKQGGYNIVTVFTEENPSSTRPYLFPKGSLRRAYDDWNIISYKETHTSWIIPEGVTEPERYMAARLVAKR
jgi:tellurite methyltransferase